MELKDMAVEELEARKAQIAIDVDAEGADLDALEAEARGINEELEARKAIESQKAEIRSAVASGEGETIIEIEKEIVEERKNMDVKEIRNSKEYIDAYAEYIKSGDPAECRALLTESPTTGGTVPVPEMVYDIVKTAWERDGIMSRVRKSYIQGNLKVGFEKSSTPAEFHKEGEEVDEEELTLGIVNLVPASIKKWISVSDEVIDLRGEAFLNYIYDELAYRIAKAAADSLVSKISTYATATVTTFNPAVQKVTATTISLGTIASAMAQLSDEAANPVVIMNKATWGAFKQAQYAAQFAADPFEGLEVVFNNTLPAFSAATSGAVYAIVGDLDQGALANFPNGEEITFKYDEMTLATSDLVRIIGRQYVALDVVAPNAFAGIVK